MPDTVDSIRETQNREEVSSIQHQTRAINPKLNNTYFLQDTPRNGIGLCLFCFWFLLPKPVVSHLTSTFFSFLSCLSSTVSDQAQSANMKGTTTRRAAGRKIKTRKWAEWGCSAARGLFYLRNVRPWADNLRLIPSHFLDKKAKPQNPSHVWKNKASKTKQRKKPNRNLNLCAKVTPWGRCFQMSKTTNWT